MSRAVGFLPIAAFGLWVSFHYAMATWSTESDAANPYVVWQGLLHDGPAFLATFRYAPDSWLIWPLPALFAAFALFGDAPAVSFTCGWGLFAGCAAMVFVVLRRTAGTVPAAAAACVVLLSNRASIGESGFLTYPVSHNASLFLGLSALGAAIAWMRQAGWPALALVVVSLCAAGLSDPWTTAAVTLPLAGATALLAAAPRRASAERRAAAELAAATGAAAVVCQTKLFGLMGFVTSPAYQFASTASWPGRTLWLARHTATWFEFLPGINGGYYWIPGGPAVLASLALLALGIGAAMPLAARGARHDAGFALLLMTCLASCGLTALAFLLLDMPEALSVGRYFMASYVFLIMGFAASLGRAWEALPVKIRAAAVGYSLLLPAAGLASAPSVWWTASLGIADARLRHFDPLVPPYDNGILRFAAFLQVHGLDYGYGSYWGDEANAVAWVTGNGVVMRPITFDAATGAASVFFTQVWPRWYGPSDEVPQNRRTFLVVSPGFDGCDNRQRCLDAAEGQFGPPAEMLTYGDSLVLVWNHRLFGLAR